MCYLCMWCIRGVYLVLVRCLCGVCAMVCGDSDP